MTFKTQDEVIGWLKGSGVRITYDAHSGLYSFPSNDLYELLKAVQMMQGYIEYLEADLDGFIHGPL